MVTLKFLPLLLIALVYSAQAAPTEEQVDAIVATVNGKPITLSDLSTRLSKPKKLTLSLAAQDPEVAYVLDSLILEAAVEEEASAKRLSTSDNEIQSYIAEVAKRNGMSAQEFEETLKKENKNLAEYKRQVRSEILKSKLASGIAQSGAAVSESEIEAHLALHPELTKSATKMSLRQILIATNTRTEDEAQTIAEQVRKRLEQGDEFADLAKELSDSPEGKDGGSLGFFKEGDLSPEVFDAVFSLKDGEYSHIVKSGAGFHIFMVDERVEEEQSNASAVREQVKELLRQRKLEERMHSFFANELLKSYTIDRKI